MGLSSRHQLYLGFMGVLTVAVIKYFIVHGKFNLLYIPSKSLSQLCDKKIQTE